MLLGLKSIRWLTHHLSSTVESWVDARSKGDQSAALPQHFPGFHRAIGCAPGRTNWAIAKESVHSCKGHW